MFLYQSCSNCSSWLHKKVTRSKNRFSKCNFQKSSSLKLQGQSFHIWYITSIRGPLPKLFKLCPWVKIDPAPGDHNFTLNYMRKTSNDFLSWTANRNLTKLIRNGPWVVPYQNCSVSCISRSRGQKIGFQNATFKNLLVWNYKAQSFHIWYIASSRGPLPKLFKLCP